MTNQSDKKTGMAPRDLISTAQRAVYADDVATLAVTWRELSTSSPSQATEVLPTLFLLAGGEGKTDCFHYLLARNKDFSRKEFEGVYLSLIDQGREDLRHAFLAHVDTFAPRDVVQYYKADLLLTYAAEHGRVDLVDEALANGAGYAADEYGKSKPLEAALRGMQLVTAERLLAAKAPVFNGVSLLTSVFSAGSHPNVVPLVELLFGHGMALDSSQLYHSVRFLENSRALSDTEKEQIGEVLDRWAVRGEFIKFPYRLKENVTFDDLRVPFPTAEGFQDTTALHRLAAADLFDEALLICKRSGASLTLRDLSRKDMNGNRFIDILGARQRLGIVNQFKFAVEDAAGIVGLLQNLPPIYQSQIDIAEIKGHLIARKVEQMPRRKVVLRRRGL